VPQQLEAVVGWWPVGGGWGGRLRGHYLQILHQLTIAMEKKLLQPAATAAFAIAAGRGAVSCCSTAEEFDEFKNNEHSRLLQ